MGLLCEFSYISPLLEAAHLTAIRAPSKVRQLESPSNKL